MREASRRPRSRLPRTSLADLPACAHGSISDAELQQLGLSRAAVLDFSASINPLGPSPRAVEALHALASGAMARYPDDGCPVLRAELAGRACVAVDQAIVANGAIELVWLLALAYLAPGDRVLVIGPTFGEYARAARIMGAAVVEWRAAASAGFVPDVAVMAAAIVRERPRLLFLCNPNNPTGSSLDYAEIAALLALMDDGLLVVDEAYAPFAERAPALTDLLDDGRLLLLRSLTKTCALAGLRLGYALSSPAVIAALDRVRPPWTVNAAALACGLAAVRDTEHLRLALAEVGMARTLLTSGLASAGVRVFPSTANFVLVEVGDGLACRAALLRRGICVRDCTSFGLPSCVRIAVRTRQECARLVAAMQEMLSNA